MQNSRLSKLLYQNGIYTIEDLVNFGPDVLQLNGMGPLRQQKILALMQNMELEFKQPAEAQIKTANRPDVTFRPTEAMVLQAQIENDAIKNRIQRKEQLIEKYNQLMVERQALLAQETALDKKIVSTVNNLKEGIPHGRKSN